MTLYTAVGSFKTEAGQNGGRHPVIKSGREDLLVDIPEMVIWVILNNRFMDFDTMDREYRKRILAFGLGDAPECGAYIDRLLQRGLVAEGHGEHGHDALFDLLSDLYIMPQPHGLGARLRSFMKLAGIRGIPLHMAVRALKKPFLSYCEKEVLALACKVRISSAEVIACIEKGCKDISSDTDILDALYSDAHTTFDNIGCEARLCLNERSCLTAIANLYLRRLVLLEV